MLEKYAKLSAKIAVYVPSTFDVNGKDENKLSEKWIEEFSILFSKLFGGCTSYNARGNWISEKNALVSESVTIIYAFSEQETIDNNLNWIISAIQNMCIEMKQECISLEYKNNLFFID